MFWNKRDVLRDEQSGDSGHSLGDSGPEGPEYPGLYLEYPDKPTLKP